MTVAIMAQDMGKESRVNARISDEQKEILQRAADIKGMSLTDFIVGTAFDEAMRTIETHDIIRLSQRDSVSFLKAMENPPLVSHAVLERFKRARKNLAK